MRKLKQLLGVIDYDLEKEYENNPEMFEDVEDCLDILLEEAHNKGFSEGTGLYTPITEDDSK